MPTPYKVRLALDLACDSIAYLTIVAATMSVGSPGAEYSPAWLFVSEYLARAERSLAAIDPSLPLELRTRIRENAMRLQQALEQHKKL
jgi:hypothetical protein